MAINSDFSIDGLPEITSLTGAEKFIVDLGGGDYRFIKASNMGVGLPTLATPTGFTATPTGTTMALAWSAVSSATSYLLERSLTGTGGWATAFSGAGLSYSDTGLSPTTLYYYRLSALASGYTTSGYATTNATTGAGFDTDAQAFFTATGISNTTQKNAINQLVLDLKAASIWAKMDAIYPIVGGTAATHKYNLKNTAQFQITFSGGLTHSATGIAPDGTTGYGDTALTPSTIVGSYALNSAHLSYFSATNVAENSTLFGVSKTDNSLSTALVPKWSDTNDYTTINQSSGPNSADYSTTAGLITGVRTATGYNMYLGSTLVKAFTFASGTAGLPDQSIVIFANKQSSAVINNFTTRACKFASIGGGLTGSEVTALNTAVTTFNTTLGR
jgi:hypothetical protein